MLKNLTKSIANTISGMVMALFSKRAQERDPVTQFDGKHQRALLIISKPVGVGAGYDFDYMEDE